MGAVISTATPAVGFQFAVQLDGLATAITISGLSIASLLAMRSAHPVWGTT